MMSRRNEAGETGMRATQFRTALLIACGLLLVGHQAVADWPYAVGLGPQVIDRQEAVGFDSAGNAYLAGALSGSGVKVGGMTYSSAGRQDIVVVKLDVDGKVLWARVAGGAGDDNVSDLVVDASGDVYITGAFCRSINPPPTTCTATFGEVGAVSVPGTVGNSYVAKLSSSGTWQWVREVSLGGGGRVDLNGLSIAGSDVFVVGSLAGSISSTTGGGLSVASRAGRTDLFYAELSAAGAWLASSVGTWPLPPQHPDTNFFGKSIVAQGNRAVALAQPFAGSLTRVEVPAGEGPTTSVPGGGSCVITGNPGAAGGATISCSGIDLSKHAAVYFGLKNDATANGATMNGEAPSGGSVFRFAASSGNSIIYSSTTTVGKQSAPTATLQVSSDLYVTSGMRKVSAPGTPENGDATVLFQVTSGAFTVTAESFSRTPTVNSGLNLASSVLYNQINTPENQRNITSVDFGFYYVDNSRLAVVQSAGGDVVDPAGIDLGFAAEALAGDGTEGLAALGLLEAGGSITYGSSTIMGPGLAVARLDLGGGGRKWAALIGDEGGQFLGRKLVFGPSQQVFVTASYGGIASFTPRTIIDLDPILLSGSSQDILVAGINDADGGWNWATRIGGNQLDRPTDIAINPSGDGDPKTADELAVAGSYLAPAKFGTFDQPCESTCTVIENTMPVAKACNPVTADTVCRAVPCPYPPLCIGGATPPNPTGFAVTISNGGEFATPGERWIVGQEVPVPAGIAVPRQPIVEIPNLPQGNTAASYFYWAPKNGAGKLFAAKETAVPATIRWPRGANPEVDGYVTVVGTTRLPDNPQIHIAGAPVDVQLSDVNRCPADSDKPFALCTRDQDCGTGKKCDKLGELGSWSFGGILFRTKDHNAAEDQVSDPAGAVKHFTATTPGWATLLFVNGPSPDSSKYPVALVVVRTVDAARNLSGQPAACTIGSPIVDPETDPATTHTDPNGKNGWVVNPKSLFDGVGADAAYQRDLRRTGRIIPVNLERDDVVGDEMMVVWYNQDARGVAWPVRPVRYDCKWPASPDTIVMASGLGSAGRCRDVRGACTANDQCKDTTGAQKGPCLTQPAITAAAFPSASVYRQDDPGLPGFNPNEEHARLFDSAAGIGQAVFALRTDLNAKLGLSEPYVLLKYRDPATPASAPLWAMRVYKVSIADQTYALDYASTAGLQLLPPYPLSVMPECKESCAPTLSDCTQRTMGTGNRAPACQEVEDPQTHVKTRQCVGGSLEGDACTTDANCDSACLTSGVADPICAAPGNLALFKDRRGLGAMGTWKGWWARARGTIKTRYHYPVQVGFFTDYDGDGTPDVAVGACEPWLVENAVQLPVTYNVSWPTGAPVLNVGETLVKQKKGLPAILDRAAVNVVFETRQTAAAQPANEPTKLVRLIDPLTPREVALTEIAATFTKLPDDIVAENGGAEWRIVAGKSGTVKLSPGVSRRVVYNSITNRLGVKGEFDDVTISGEPLLLLNVLTPRERDELIGLSTDMNWKKLVDALYAKSRNPNAVDADGDMKPDDGLLIGFTMRGKAVVPEHLLDTKTPKALTAGLAEGSGWVTVAFDNDRKLPSATPLMSVFRVDCGVYQGQVQVLPSSNLFDEAVTLRHSGDFAGDPSSLAFEWYYAPKETTCDADALRPPQFPAPVGSPWIPVTGGTGVSDITFSGPGVASLADTCVMVRYTGYPLCGNTAMPSQWAGEAWRDTSPTDPHAQLVPGWLSRVTRGLNPFDQRTTDFRNNMVNTLVGALTAAGKRFEGPVSFSPGSDALNSVGLIEVYETVLDRAEDLSINQGLSIGAVNKKLLDVAARTSDLYMLFGNEAYQDALDPTIGFDTKSAAFGSAAPSIFAFQDQTDSLLTEELGLLRGIERTGPRPQYNRLPWNFTGRDGQIAYVENYNITNVNGDATIDETDAKQLYPQGHGDAWGHYLTALTGYYKLLRHAHFTWIPREDSVLVSGTEVSVNFSDERRFATAAAARARTGAQIVDLSYRQRWVDDPAGQWQGYKDTDRDRAWGVSEWAARAGQGAYFDWVAANAVLPPTSAEPPGIRKVDRTTVKELSEIAGQSLSVQAQMDTVDKGLNPLGLGKNVVPFDVDPNFLQVGSTTQGKHHYEQIAERAGAALANAVRVFDYANEASQRLRENQDSATQFGRNVAAQERDYNNRLIEIFGTPYPEDKGPGKTYPSDYDGPDTLNWSVVDQSELTGLYPELLAGGSSTYGLTLPRAKTAPCTDMVGTCRYDSSSKLVFKPDGSLLKENVTVAITLSNSGFGRLKDPSWTRRESPGELQLARSDLLQARAQFERAVEAYNGLITDIECVYSTIVGQNRLAAARLKVLNKAKNSTEDFQHRLIGAKTTELSLKRAATVVRNLFEMQEKALPTVVGLAFDATSPARAATSAIKSVVANVLELGADAAEVSQLAIEQAQELASQSDAIEIQGLEDDFESFNLLGTLSEKMVQEPVLRLEALTLAENVRQMADKQQAILARGTRLFDELEVFRKRTASDVAESRYHDMAFRVFRNDALQKYRAQFDLASRYVYLTAAAYDYETNLQGDHSSAGSKFLTDIVRQRNLGQFVGGQPVANSPGLGDTMAQMSANFSVLKGQLGFNTPQTETNRFSLRKELFRVLEGSNDQWRTALAQHRVANLWTVDAFRRFANPPAPEGSAPLPGIVIPFPTTITFQKNFFGWPLSGEDSAYDSGNFATKVRTMGVWFRNYNAKGLSDTPRVYLIPVGEDILRASGSGNFKTRAWQILDQRIPVPFALGASTLSDQTWTPLLGRINAMGMREPALSDPMGDIRKHGSFRAYHDTGSLTSGQVTTESRAIARSVWNTRWVLIITGGTLLADANEGLNTFIYGKKVTGGGTVVDPAGNARDGNGVSDILIFFQTYALPGS